MRPLDIICQKENIACLNFNLIVLYMEDKENKIFETNTYLRIRTLTFNKTFLWSSYYNAHSDLFSLLMNAFGKVLCCKIRFGRVGSKDNSLAGVQRIICILLESFNGTCDTFVYLLCHETNQLFLNSAWVTIQS